jgi:hypothetical protein
MAEGNEVPTGLTNVEVHVTPALPLCSDRHANGAYYIIL